MKTPTMGEITALAVRYDQLRNERNYIQEKLTAVEAEAIKMVEAFGFCPPRAEKSRRLTGLGCDLTVTHSDAVTIETAEVEKLKEALEANNKGEYFHLFFRPRIGYEAVTTGTVEIKNKRLAERVKRMLRTCFKISPRKPALKVNVTDEAQKIVAWANQGVTIKDELIEAAWRGNTLKGEA